MQSLKSQSFTEHELEKDVSVGSSTFSYGDNDRPEKTVWWKVDLRILPVVTMIYLLSWLDRTNLGNARVAGLQKELKITNVQYSIALTVTFIPYIATEIPSNLLLKIVGPNVLLPTLLISWGIVTTLQGNLLSKPFLHRLVHNFAGLLACRFFIGFLEGGVVPGLVLYLSFFYPRERLQIRISAFFSAASLSGAFSGLLATGIMDMSGKGGKTGWSWIFILEGLFTVIFGVLAFFVLPRSPAHARFLDTREREYVTAQLRKDGAIGEDEQTDGFSWKQVRSSFKQPQVLFLAFVYFFTGTILYSLSYFLPSIVLGLGYSPIRAQLMTVPPYASAFVVTNVTSFIADRYHCRGFVAIFSALCCMIGFAMFLGSHTKSVQYGSLFLTITGINCSSPALAAWVANNSSPHVRRATSLALLAMVTNTGGILSTWLLGYLSPAPRYTSATITLLVFSLAMASFAALNLGYLYSQNKKKAVMRATTVKADEPKGLGDRSAWFIYIL